MIKVYSIPNSLDCSMTKDFLKANNVKFEEINLEENEEELDLIKAIGFKRLPVVIVTKNNSFECAFSGFQIDKLEGLVKKRLL